MRYELRFSTDPEEDPEVLKMLIDANNRSDLLYNILNNKWETSQEKNVFYLKNRR